MDVQYRFWGRAAAVATTLFVVGALCTPMAAAQDRIWHPIPLPSAPVVGSHPIARTVLGPPKGYKALADYQPAAPDWPTAGSATVELTRNVPTAAPPPATEAAGTAPSPTSSPRARTGAVPARAAASASASGATAPGHLVEVTTPVRAGSLPVWIGPVPVSAAHPRGVSPDNVSTAMSAPAQVRVQVASHAQAIAAGANGMLVGLTPADSTAGSGNVQVIIDYSVLAKAYGGGYGSRLQLFQVPACALTDPSAKACRTRTPLSFTNRAGSEELVATLPLGSAAAPKTGSHSALASATNASPSGTGLVVTSGASGSQGNYAATSLNPSGTWQTTGTGSYAYSYPLDIPTSIGANAPSVAFTYDSQSVDGETSARNSQSSWLGDGWDYDPGFIERSYRSCGSLLDGSGNHVLKGSGDDCWGGDNATISFGSISGALVPTTMDTSVPGIVAQWKLQSDDGTIVQELSGADNGLYQGIYYRVLSTNGSIAYFGADHAPSTTAENAVPQSGSPTDASTNAAWGVPVLDPVSGDPCYSSATGTASRCSTTQNEGWRWNLDFTVSPTGFVQRFDYSTETNYYDLGGGQVAATNGSGTLTPYTRGGTLTQISYGYQLADELAGRTPAAAVVFTSAQRCQASSSFDCSQAISTSNATYWPDVPYDLDCPSSDSTTLPPGSTSVPANVCVTSSPTFWTTTRLDHVTTEVNVAGSGLTAVDTYQLGQVYSDAGGVADPVTGSSGVDSADEGELQAVMWLQSIRHTGDADAFDGGSTPVTLNQVTFSGTEIDNRVNDSSPAAPPLFHPRISSIQTETGEEIAVVYNQTPCAGVSLSIADADENTHSCYPVYWTPPGESLPVADWFNKITVQSVTTSDQTIANGDKPNGASNPGGSSADSAAGSPDQISNYSYGTPAWHRDDSALTDDQYRTWDQFRGFSTVTVNTGAAPDPITQTTTIYLQGMDGDYLANGTQRSVTVPDTVGDKVTDSNWLAGTALETDTYTAAGGTIDAKTVTPVVDSTITATSAQTPWTDWNSTDDPPPAVQPAMSTLPPLTARMVTDTTGRSYSLLKNGSWREDQTVTDYDAEGRVSTVDSIADVTGASAAPVENCATTTYATPSASSAMMLTYPDQNTTITGACGGSSPTLLSAKRLYYGGDGTLSSLGTFGQLSATGEVTGSQTATSATGGTPGGWQTTAAMTYDGAGRVTQTLDAANHPTSTTYTPNWSSAGGNTDPTKEVSTNSQGWTTTSYLDPLRELATENLDANNAETDITYDALGRRTAVWMPGHTKSAYPSLPNETFAYSINPGAVPAPNGTVTSPGAPSAVTTDTLLDSGSYATSIDIYDGMLQLRQTQTSPQGDSGTGSLISDTFYDSHGWPRVTYSAYSEPNTEPSTTLFGSEEAEIPSETSTVYDGQGRPITSILFHQGVEQWQTSTSYPGADETDNSQIQNAAGVVIPGGGGTATATMTNALGQTTSSVVENTDAQVTLTGGQVIPSGTSLSSDSVQLTMQAGGNLALTSLASGSTLWSTNTSSSGAYAEFGTDGNLHVYSATGTSLWSTGLSATTGSTLALQDDGNLVVDTSAGSPAWAAGTGAGDGGKAPQANSTTSYTYYPAGQVHTITDSAGNTWSYQYNLLGEQTQSVDPNTGTTNYGPYDVLGNLEQSTDSRGQTLSYQYDWDNRLTGEYTGAWTATPAASNQLTGYTYDTLEKGYPTSSTSYIGGSSTGKAYTEAITGYNSSYEPLGQTLTIPASDGFALAGATTAPASGTVTYTMGSTYNANSGLPATTTYQADGGLPAETLGYVYNGAEELNSIGGTIGASLPDYLTDTVHDALGNVLEADYNTASSKKEVNTYAQFDPVTGALTQTSDMIQGVTAAPDVVNYRYNEAGELTAVDDLQNNTTHDTQCFTYNSMQRLTQAWTDNAGIDNTSQSGISTPSPGDIGSCNTTTPETATVAGAGNTSGSGASPAPYWQTDSYDLLGDRTSLVNHDTTGNAADNTTQTIAYPGANGTATATDPDQATSVTTANPSQGSTTTLTPGYTDTNGSDDGNITSRAVTSSGDLLSGVKTTAGGNLCLADPGASTTSGTAVILWGCGAGGQNATIGTDGTVRIQGLCLDTSGGSIANDATVVLDTCASGSASQQWKATANTLVNTHSGRCLADPGNNQTQGAAKQIIWTCGSSGQTYTTPTDNTAIATGQTQTLTYNPQGLTASVTTPSGTSSQTGSYIYDASGNLLEQTTSTGATAQTRILYLFGGAEQITLNVPNKSWTALRNYSAPDGTTITRTSAGTLAYQVANAQETAEATIDASSLGVTRRYYDPYGNARGTVPTTWISTDENHGFVGQPTDASSGLDLLGARNYDPSTGRFLSPDPVFEAGDPNQMGGYTYAGDSPSTGSDPSGLMLPIPIGDDGYSSNGGGMQYSDGVPCIACPSDPSPQGSIGQAFENAMGSVAANVVSTEELMLDSNLPGVGQVVNKYITTPAMNYALEKAGVNQNSFTFGVTQIAVGLLALPDAAADAADAVNAASVVADLTADVDAASAASSDSLPEMQGGPGRPGVAKDPVAAADDTRAVVAKPSDPDTGAPSTDGQGGTSPKCSFAPTTPVLLADGKTKPIGKLKVGDKVESANPNTGKEEGARTVQHIWINHDTDLLDVTVSTGHGHTAVLHTTSNHPFWDDTTHTWVAAGKLHLGDRLASTGGQHPVVAALKVTPGAANRWNLTVQQLHTYYVVAGGTPILVHNTDDGCPVNVTVRWQPGMPKSQFNLKAGALQDLSDQGVLVKAPNPVARDSSITNKYKANLIARVFDQFGATNPEFAASLRTRILTQMNPDHVWELQLSGPDDASNLHILDAFTNQDIGRQIWGQIRGLPDGTPIGISIEGPP
jgi:RHS repeat-associated protein